MRVAGEATHCNLKNSRAHTLRKICRGRSRQQQRHRIHGVHDANRHLGSRETITLPTLKQTYRPSALSLTPSLPSPMQSELCDLLKVENQIQKGHLASSPATATSSRLNTHQHHLQTTSMTHIRKYTNTTLQQTSATHTLKHYAPADINDTHTQTQKNTWTTASEHGQPQMGKTRYYHKPYRKDKHVQGV